MTSEYKCFEVPNGKGFHRIISSDVKAIRTVTIKDLVLSTIAAIVIDFTRPDALI